MAEQIELEAFLEQASGGGDAAWNEMAERVKLDPLLEKARQGDKTAWNEAFSVMYNALRRMARSRFGSYIAGRTTPTGLTNATILRLLGVPLDVPDRAHFLALNAKVMRSMLIDRARKQKTTRHGADYVMIPIGDGGYIEVRASKVDLDFYLEVDLGVDKLRVMDPVAANVFVRRYWYGSTNEEVAEELKLTPAVAIGKWNYAKAKLREILEATR